MRLGIFGDSFSDSSENPVKGVTSVSWIYELARNMEIEFDNFSYPGTSLWYSYKHFIENYQNYTHIIFTYTDSNRWPCLPEEMKRFSSVYTEDKLSRFPSFELGSSYKVMKQLVYLHRYIFDEQLNTFLLQQIFNQVNSICKKNNIKLVNILPFVDCPHGDQIDLTNATGSCLTNLITVSENELRDMSKGGRVPCRTPELEFLEQGVDYRRNHINSPNNILMADVIQKEFNRVKPKVFDMFKDDRFVYDTQILLDYIKEIKKALNVK